MTVESLYKRAKDALTAGNYAESIKLYETLESRFPYGIQSQQAIIDTAYAHYRLGERAQAIAAADRFIKLYPNHENVDYAYFVKGLAKDGLHQVGGDGGEFAGLDHRAVARRDRVNQR